MKLNIFDVTRNKHVEFLPQLATAEKLSSQVQNLKEEMLAVRNNIDTDVSSKYLPVFLFINIDCISMVDVKMVTKSRKGENV